MRLREIGNQMVRALTGGFEPTMRLDVYDRYKERTGQGTVKVAEVLSDGVRGELRVLDPSLDGVLRPMFTEKRTTLIGGGVLGADSFTREGTVESLVPYKRATLEHALNSELPTHNLRGELVAVDKR